jgi:hypothetical protein
MAWSPEALHAPFCEALAAQPQFRSAVRLHAFPKGMQVRHKGYMSSFGRMPETRENAVILAGEAAQYIAMYLQAEPFALYVVCPVTASTEDGYRFLCFEIDVQ